MQNWLIFDAMGVIFEVGDDTRDLLRPYIMQHKPEIDEQFMLDLYIKASLGEIASKKFWQLLGFDDWQQTEHDYLDTCLTLDRGFIKTAEWLSQSYNLAMLSNDISEWSVYLRKKFDLDRLFKIVVISGAVGCRKPDKRIYEILLSRINAPAERCIFFDDRVKNLIAAKELGIKSILFNRDQVDPGKFVSVKSFEEIRAGILESKR
jgi:putative hydrolase of the HAD superfamily